MLGLIHCEAIFLTKYLILPILQIKTERESETKQSCSDLIAAEIDYRHVIIDVCQEILETDKLNHMQVQPILAGHTVTIFWKHVVVLSLVMLLHTSQ